MFDFSPIFFMPMVAGLIYLAVMICILWLIFRFVTAHESMADSLRLIAYELRDRPDRDQL